MTQGKIITRRKIIDMIKTARVKTDRDKTDKVKTDKVIMDRVKIEKVKIVKEEVTPSKKVDPVILRKVAEAVEKNYTNDILLRLSSLFLYPFLFARRKDFEEALGAPREISKRMKKPQLVEQLATVFASRVLFDKLMAAIPSDAAQALSILVWDGAKKVGELEKEIKTEILVRPQKEKSSFYYYEHTKNIKGDYLFFCFRDRGYDYYYGYRTFSPDRYTIFLPDEIRKVLKTYLTPPEDYFLSPLDTIAKTDFIHKSEGEVFKELPLYYEYIRQGHLQFLKDGKPVKASLRHLKQSSTAKEFYEGWSKELDLLKTNLMVALVRTAIKLEKPKDPLELLKQLFDSYKAQVGISWSMSNFLSHIKVKAGTGVSYLDSKKKINASVFSLLKELPTGQWISIENFLRFIMLRDINVAPVEASSASRFLYVIQQGSSYDSKAYIDDAMYHEAIIAPLIKGSMFLFAAFGLVDMAYDLPTNKALKVKGGEYLSVFDGIKYVQLTELGAYLSGLTSQYTKPIQEEKRAEIILDTNRLIITLHGEDRLISMILENFANQISENRYKIDYASFLKECASKKDITQRIQLFKTEIASKPPQVWLDFFDRVLARVHPLTPQEALKVFKLSPDKELIHLVATDSILKQYILKADDFHIIVEQSNFPKVRQRLESLGYLI